MLQVIFLMYTAYSKVNISLIFQYFLMSWSKMQEIRRTKVLKFEGETTHDRYFVKALGERQS